MQYLASIAAVCALALSITTSFAAAPHVHGIGTLQLVLEGNILNAELRLPAMDVVGFEHAPREKKDKEAVQKAQALLKDAHKVLLPADEARCTAAPGTVESELLNDRGAEPKHDPHGPPDDKAHADFEALYRFDCAHPEALKKIKALVFQQLPKLEQLDVETVTPHGQQRQRLMPGQDTITLP